MTKSDKTGSPATRVGMKKRKGSNPKPTTTTKNSSKTSAQGSQSRGRGHAKVSSVTTPAPKEIRPVVVKHEDIVPEGLPRKYFLKSTFNTQDIMHAPVEKTLKMLDKILAGERLFTM